MLHTHLAWRISAYSDTEAPEICQLVKQRVVNLAASFQLVESGTASAVLCCLWYPSVLLPLEFLKQIITRVLIKQRPACSSWIQEKLFVQSSLSRMFSRICTPAKNGNQYAYTGFTFRYFCLRKAIWEDREGNREPGCLLYHLSKTETEKFMSLKSDDHLV